MWRRTVCGVIAALTVVAPPALLRGDVPSLTSAADALEAAVRQGPAAPDPCAEVAMVADSLVAGNRDATDAAFEDVGIPAIVDAVSSRRIPVDVQEPLSGVRAVRRLLESGVGSTCWVVALGSNDLLWLWNPGDYGSTREETARNYLAMMLDPIRSAIPGARVWWVNLHHRGWPSATTIFNAALAERARIDDRFEVIDWFGVADPNPGWFLDRVHVNGAGSRARATLIAQTVGVEPGRGTPVDRVVDGQRRSGRGAE